MDAIKYLNLYLEENPGTTHQQIADELGYERTTITKWLSGRSIPNPDAQARILERFSLKNKEVLMHVITQESELLNLSFDEINEKIAELIKNLELENPFKKEIEFLIRLTLEMITGYELCHDQFYVNPIEQMYGKDPVTWQSVGNMLSWYIGNRLNDGEYEFTNNSIITNATVLATQMFDYAEAFSPKDTLVKLAHQAENSALTLTELLPEQDNVITTKYLIDLQLLHEQM